MASNFTASDIADNENLNITTPTSIPDNSTSVFPPSDTSSNISALNTTAFTPPEIPKFCKFTRNLIAPSNEVILTTYDQNGHIQPNAENLYDELPMNFKLEYTCKDSRKIFRGVNITVCTDQILYDQSGNWLPNLRELIPVYFDFTQFINGGFPSLGGLNSQGGTDSGHNSTNQPQVLAQPTWQPEPHNTNFRKYCIDPEKEAIREKIAYYISLVSIIIIVFVIMFFCTSCLIRRARFKKKIRAEQLDRQQRQMHDNQAYLDNSSRFQLVG